MNTAAAYDLIVHGAALPTFLLDAVAQAVKARQVLPQPPQMVRFTEVCRQPAQPFLDLHPLLEQERLNWAFVPRGLSFSDFRLICFDMDSTLITIECIDELADFAGKKQEVAAVTEAAMKGELSYPQSLRQRLKLLAGLDARVLARVFGERLLLNPGVRELMDAVHDCEMHSAILSGGFTYFTERLRIELGFDFATSNELEIAGGRLTGNIVGDIVDANAKAEHLLRLCRTLNIDRRLSIACGDGANDLAMMHEAGLSVAFQAKPSVKRQVDIAINHGGLDLLPLFLRAS